MNARFNALVFPDGKPKAFTLSYDDGSRQDRRLAELFRKYGLRCSFNLNSSALGISALQPGTDVDVSRIRPEELATVYAGHEICGHGLTHSPLECLGAPLSMHEILEDKRRLEKLAKRPLKIFAAPFGRCTEQTIEQLRIAGYQGARGVYSTHDFSIPDDFLNWEPTGRHTDSELMKLAKKFVECEKRHPFDVPKLFYVWGHSYEFDVDNNWNVVEDLAALMYEHKDEIWFATNGEIVDYVTAYRRLEISVDGSFIFNPSAVDVIICTENGIVMLPAGRVTEIRC